MQAIVAAFQAPAPPTQAAFLFHATETLNPCMWATDFDQSQVDFAAFPGQPPCLNCKVRLHMRAYLYAQMMESSAQIYAKVKTISFT